MGLTSNSFRPKNFRKRKIHIGSIRARKRNNAFVLFIIYSPDLPAGRQDRYSKKEA